MRRLNRPFVSIILLVALILSASTLLAAPSSQEEENKALIRRYVEELWIKGDLAVADEIFATNFVNHNPDMPDVRSLEGFKQWVTVIHTAFPDFDSTVEDVIAEGDKVVARWTIRGTHEGDLMGIPPTGKQITLPGTTTYRIADGKIVEAWWSYDALAFNQQLGLLHPPEQTLTNKAIVRRYQEEVWNKGNLAVVDELIAPDYVRHCQVLPPEEVRGPEGIKQFYQESVAVFPDWQETIEFMVAEGDKVVYYSTASGTQKGPMGPFPATGKQISLKIIAVHRLEGGQIVESWVTWDELTALTQLGLFPPPGEGGE